MQQFSGLSGQICFPGTEALQTSLARRPLRLDDLTGGERVRTDVSNLALVDEVAQRPKRLLDVGVRIGAVDLVEVDPVGVQASQRVLDLGDDSSARVAPVVVVFVYRHVDLRRQHDVVAAPFQRLADNLLGLAGRVDVGGVEEVDPGVEGSVDDAD